MLKTLPEVILDLNIDDKHLFLVAESVAIYLDRDQLPTLQYMAKEFFTRLFTLNSPLIYGTLLARFRMHDYVFSIHELLRTFSI